MEKQGALELSIGTIVIIVIAMSMLILGLVLVRTIFTGATDSINILDDKVKAEIQNLFPDEGANLVVKLGEGQTAKIKPDSGAFGVGIGARTPDGSAVGGRDRLQYKLELDSSTANNCASVLGQRRVEDLFITPVNTFNQFDQFDGSIAFAIVQVNIPKGIPTCTQKVYIDVRDTQGASDVYGGDFFNIEVLKEGFFD